MKSYKKIIVFTPHSPLLKLWFQMCSILPVHLYNHSCLYPSLWGNHLHIFHQDYLQQRVSCLFSWKFFPTSNTGLISFIFQFCFSSERKQLFSHHSGILFSVLVLILRLPSSEIYSLLSFSFVVSFFHYCMHYLLLLMYDLLAQLLVKPFCQLYLNGFVKN